MLKRDEIKVENSCLNNAKDDEMIFVLLARDPAASVAIRCWIHERLRIGLNKAEDMQIINARKCVDFMDKQRNQ